MSLLSWQRNVALAPYTTYKIGGAAHLFLKIKTLLELEQALKECSKMNLPFYILGKGSNTLFDDRGFSGAVLLNEIDFCEQSEDTFEVGGGTSFAWLGLYTAKKGYSGLEFAAGVPGSLGGAIYMNAGAHGQEVQEVIESVLFIDDQGERHLFHRKEIEFKYRWSSFHELKGVIAQAKLKLAPLKTARERQKEHLSKRQKSQPLKERSCGCAFRNPEGFSIGKLIEELGLKGLKRGDAEISLIHGNFIVNKGSAKAQDVLDLIKLVETKIFEQKGIRLIREVRFVPYEVLL